MAHADLRANRQASTRPEAGRPGGRTAMRPGGWALIWSGAAFAVALTAYLTDVATHPLRFTFRFFDLFIYNHAGELVRHAPATLYTWHYMIDVQYLYTPFAALGF